ncbi:MAG: hypothetical protein OEV94_08305 [Deltaproteobacteria bacterium]|nr:hypothetical protein [Deltaproteobacteria bacterium]
MKLIYEGSVKNVYQDANPEHLWFDFTDDYSVFDWGKMPDPIPGKGEALAALAKGFFDQLADPARWKDLGLHNLPDTAGILPLKHHALDRQGSRLKVKKVDVPRLAANQVGGLLVYDYSYPFGQNQLLPLEVIFRFGAPKGSSLFQRKDWYAFPIHEGMEFPEPLIEFSTKLESKDRMVTYQEAAHILKGDTARLKQLHSAARAVALFLQRAFQQQGLKLWDGKVEWALVDGALTLVDSIGPDELRVSQDGAVLSKQFLRDFYLDKPWYAAIEKAKALAQERGVSDWKTIAREELKAQPPALSPAYLEAARLLYQDFVEMLVHQRPATRFLNAVKHL